MVNNHPYFYIIEHIETSIKYAGIRISKSSNPSELLTEDGYKTSSKIVKEIIKNEGLSSFRILEIKNFDDAKSCRNYETRFLKDYDCRNSDEWFNTNTAKSSIEHIPKDIKKSYKIKELPSYEYLHECFEYDKYTGMLKWKIRPLEHFKNSHRMNSFNARYGGKECIGKDARNYYIVKLDTIAYKVHRIIWKMMTGNDSDKFIDHINRNPSDNSWNNLREASPQENQRNRKLQKNNSTKFVGVHYSKNHKKYAAQASLNRKKIHLGYFDNPEDAAKVHKEFIEKHYGEFIPK